MNVSRYNTPLLPLSAINEFFAAPFKKARRPGRGRLRARLFSSI
ncbi:hypothetical protein [Cohnella rhizosphaerae]